MLKKLIALFTAVFGCFFACYTVLFVLNVWMLVNQLPFCQEAAHAWMMGIPTTVCVEGDIARGVPELEYDGPMSAMSDLPVPYPVKFFFGHDPNYFGGKWHGGVDMPCPVGTPIRTTMGGIVSFAGESDVGYGNLVVIQNGAYQTYYAHASQFDVSAGDVVEAGEVVALSGNTGFSTGPHLHYEVRINGQQVNPLETTLPGQSEGQE